MSTPGHRPQYRGLAALSGCLCGSKFIEVYDQRSGSTGTAFKPVCLPAA